MQELYAHQKDGVDFLIEHPRCALFWDCGTGKTLPTIRAMDERMAAKEIFVCFVLCPKVAAFNWANEIVENAEHYEQIFVLDGPPDERSAEIADAWEQPCIVILNYEKLQKHSEELIELAQGEMSMVVFDESQYIKNPRAKRSKLSHKLADAADYVVLLTGTPIGNSIEDVWSQYRAMDGGETFGTSYFRFRHTYLKEVVHVPHMWVPKRGSASKVKAKMWRLADSKTKEECLDLPSMTRIIVPVQFEPGHKELYDDFAATLIADYVDDEGEWSRARAANAAVAAVKLQQITSGFFYPEQGKPTELQWQPKLEVLNELVSEIAPVNKIVVWARFRRDISVLLDALNEYNPISIEAKHSSEERAQACKVFEEDDSVRVMVSNPRCGGVAINLQTANYAIYFSNDYSHITRVQSRDRIHRIGQDQKVIIYDLVVPGTIDGAVITALDRKQSLADYIQGVGSIESVVYGNGR